MIIADNNPLNESINLTKLIVSDLHNLKQVLDPLNESILNPQSELITAEKDPLNESIELTNIILSDLHKLSRAIMAEGNDFKSDIELVEWKKKLDESRETDRKLNAFVSRHRSQSAPRGRSQSDERKDPQSSRIIPTDDLARRSRRQLFRETDEVEDKDQNDKDSETEIPKRETSLNRDRSPLKGKIAETSKKVISKLKSLELSDLTKSDSSKNDPPTLPPTLPSHPTLTPSLHSQMRVFLPRSCSNEDQKDSDEEMSSEPKEKKDGDSESVIDWLDDIIEAGEDRHKRLLDFEENISQCAELVKDQNVKI